MRLKKRTFRMLGALPVLAVIMSCGSLDVENPNAPDRGRALADPNAVEAVAGGAFRTWFNAYTSLRGAGVLAAQANSYSSSWNNGNLNFYSSVDNPTAAPDQWNRMSRTWQNDPSAAGRTSIESFWSGGLDESSTNLVPRGGYYNSLSAANAALFAIRHDSLLIRNIADTKRTETVAQFMQGASLMMLSLLYDKAYIVDENSDLNNLAYQSRKQVRDTAVKLLVAAAELATENEFDVPAAWANGIEYTNTDIARISYTMAAMTLAYYPRDAAEDANQVDWAKVAEYASKGMSTGTPVDWMFVQDGYNSWISEQMNWFVPDGGRIHTRLAHLLDPATQKDPWPEAGNPQPNSPDKRLGDGSFGNASTASSFKIPIKTANAGTDFVWTSQGQVFRPDRGQYHQSNIGHVRYDFTGTLAGSGTYGGFGAAPAINAIQNDLLWAEALLHLGGGANITKAVQLIDKTRVGRGGLASSAAASGNVGSTADGPCMSNNKLAKDGAACTLFSMLLYEQEVELVGLGPAIFWAQRKLPVIIGGGWAGDNSPRRVIAGLLPGTPREMPVPSKELGVKGEALYTWGGSTPNSPTPP